MRGTIHMELLLLKQNYYRTVLSYITLFSKYMSSSTSIKTMLPFGCQQIYMKLTSVQEITQDYEKWGNGINYISVSQIDRRILN